MTEHSFIQSREFSQYGLVPFRMLPVPTTQKRDASLVTLNNNSWPNYNFGYERPDISFEVINQRDLVAGSQVYVLDGCQLKPVYVLQGPCIKEVGNLPPPNKSKWNILQGCGDANTNIIDSFCQCHISESRQINQERNVGFEPAIQGNRFGESVSPIDLQQTEKMSKVAKCEANLELLKDFEYEILMK